jgi:hypothetical protein
LQDSGEPLAGVQRKNLFSKLLTGDAATIELTMSWINNDNGRVRDEPTDIPNLELRVKSEIHSVYSRQSAKHEQASVDNQEADSGF